MKLLRVGSVPQFGRLSLLSGLLLCAVEPAISQDVHLVVSSQAGDRMTSKAVVHFVKGGTPPAGVIQIHDDVRYQKMDGFGASFLEAGLMCINSLPAKEQEDVLRSLFDVKTG